MLKSASSQPTRPCPFCNHEYKKLGNHLPYCPERKGADYSCFLAEKTLQKRKSSVSSKRQPCPHCGRRYLRLDTHLRTSAQCRTINHHSDHPSNSIVTTGPSVPHIGPLTATSCHNSPSVSSPLAQVTISSSQLRPFNHPQSPDEWQVANEDLANTIVPAVLAAPTVEEKNRVLCEGIFNYFTAKFGPRTQKARRKSKSHTSQKETLATLRGKRNKARNNLRRAKRQGAHPTDLETLATAFHQFLREYNKVSRAEKRRAHKAEASTARIHCTKNFSRFAKQVLDEDHNSNATEPGFDHNTAAQFFSRVYSSTPRMYEQPSWLPTTPPPQHPFQQGEITSLEITEVIKRVRSQAAPSPLDQITYRVLKHCSSLIPALLSLFQLCWESQTVPHAWKQGVIRLIPKASAKGNPREPSNFRPIALTSCVGKVFTTILKNRWLRFMTSNGYLDTTVQKAFLPGIPAVREANGHYFRCTPQA